MLSSNYIIDYRHDIIFILFRILIYTTLYNNFYKMSKKLKLNDALITSRSLRSENKDHNKDISTTTSKYFNDKVVKKIEKKKRTPVKIKYEEMENITDSKINKIENLQEDTIKEDINVINKWEPSNWETNVENIKEMRKYKTAPVDEMGCHKCTDPKATAKVARYQSLIALMLSSQTKDQVTHAAMQRLITYGCTPEIIAGTPDDTLEKLIYPVGFWKVCTIYILIINLKISLELKSNYIRYII